MKVKELIKQLDLMDRELEVYVYDEHGEYVKVSDVCDFTTYEEDEDGDENEIDSALVY